MEIDSRLKLTSNKDYFILANITMETFLIQPKLPEYDYSLVIRTDFSDNIIWDQICKEIQMSQSLDGFRASVECISNEKCSSIGIDNIRSILPSDTQREFVFLVDSVTISLSNHPVLCVDITSDPVRTFRVIPSEVWSVENNLRLGNMDFTEFLDSVDNEGIFRGFFSKNI